MKNSTRSIGFVYVLSNESMPHLIKIGFTYSLAEDRSKQLFNTSVATPFVIEFRLMTSKPKEVEGRAHDLLSKFRVSSKREFFNVPVDLAIDAIRLAAIEVAGIDSWHSDAPNMLKHGDRITLMLEEGQIFGVTSYENMFSTQAKILDLWECHSNYDSLDMFVTESGDHVSGFSDDDLNCCVDPTPFLDREHGVKNGIIIGLEKLVPGDRLVWIPNYGARKNQKEVVFEANDYVQIVCRTWSPKIGHHGMPLLLIDYMQEVLCHEAHCALWDTINLPIPRSWAPRENRLDEWEQFGHEFKAPEYWIQQLRKRDRRPKI